jgi:hypothetical protein
MYPLSLPSAEAPLLLVRIIRPLGGVGRARGTVKEDIGSILSERMVSKLELAPPPTIAAPPLPLRATRDWGSAGAEFLRGVGAAEDTSLPWEALLVCKHIKHSNCASIPVSSEKLP